MTATLARRRFAPNLGRTASSVPCALCSAPQRRFIADGQAVCRACRPLVADALREIKRELLAATWPDGRPAYGSPDREAYDRAEWRLTLSVNARVPAAIERVRAAR